MPPAHELPSALSHPLANKVKPIRNVPICNIPICNVITIGSHYM